MRYLLELTPGEIAETLELPRGTVNSRLRRGLDALGGVLEEELLNEQRLRDELKQAPIDDGARARALGVVRAAFLEVEPARRPRRWAPALAVAGCVLALAAVAVAATEPGDAVARWVRDVLGVGRENAKPALVRVPGGGRLLVTAPGSAWVVAADGSRRRLGDYAGASWSPHGRFVVAWRDGELLALEPNGRVRWSLSRPGRIATARWSRGLGYRVAYVSGGTLRVVAGDGTGDHRHGPAAAVAPAWRPDGAHVLAYVDRRDHVRVVDVDSGRLLLALGAGRRADRARVVARRPAPAGRDPQRLAAARRRRPRARAPVRVRASPTSPGRRAGAGSPSC